VVSYNLDFAEDAAPVDYMVNYNLDFAEEAAAPVDYMVNYNLDFVEEGAYYKPAFHKAMAQID
jgi:hypothetical protein